MLFKTLIPSLPLEVGWLNQSIKNRGPIPTCYLDTLMWLSMPLCMDEDESLFPVWDRPKSKHTMVTVILGLLLRTGVI